MIKTDNNNTTTAYVKTQLLCTFTDRISLLRVVDKIQDIYKIPTGKIYILQNTDNIQEFICTYNIEIAESMDFSQIPNTITVHRKKHTRTIYTINSLNELIKNFNNGVLDTSFEVPWENFQDMVIVSNNNELQKINTKLYKVVNVID
jgi:uncharacterized protein (DUF1015 family)